MAEKSVFNLLLPLLLLVTLSTGGNCDITFMFENNCQETLWFASSPSDGDLDPENGPDTLEIFSMPDPWSGSIWVRTKCTTNLTGYFSCETGDCGSGTIDCQGPPPTFPVTELNFNINQNVVSYEVSLIHGHNIAVRIQPNGGSLTEGGSGPCPVVDCIEDISNICPAPLVAKNKDGVYVGCYNACDILKDPKYCRDNEYSQLFKKLCNLAHTYPGDSNPPLYKCSGAISYNITFCPVL
ncbi:hypothetical protein P3X46_016950 [Hevea brasiliensis]|uniref:Thaumatin-like protein n=1 Tax=Hevea brasiliensis TaxID=3981 RepID=A0ABQ9M0Q9_HEVBR|nr:thaumatin-like protein 1b [Hevea brasiliensis]KAJ9173857.1 hypothetical protein P3X46_016950 [Hevea brasiliensis]